MIILEGKLILHIFAINQPEAFFSPYNIALNKNKFID